MHRIDLMCWQQMVRTQMQQAFEYRPLLCCKTPKTGAWDTLEVRPCDSSSCDFRGSCWKESECGLVATKVLVASNKVLQNKDALRQ